MYIIHWILYNQYQGLRKTNTLHATNKMSVIIKLIDNILFSFNLLRCRNTKQIYITNKTIKINDNSLNILRLAYIE